MDRPTDFNFFGYCYELLLIVLLFSLISRTDSRAPLDFIDLLETRPSDGPAGIPSRREASPHRVRADSQDLSHAHLRRQRGRREVPLLVLPQVRTFANRRFVHPLIHNSGN